MADTTVTGAGLTAGAFVREERYIVIKRKNLSEAQERDLRAGMKLRGIGTVECVVVESDWPEYETVWKMIEARVTGHAVSAAEGDLLGRLIDAAREHIDAGLQFLVADSDHDNARGVNQPRDTYAASFERKLAAAKRVDDSRNALNAILSQAQAREVTR